MPGRKPYCDKCADAVNCREKYTYQQSSMGVFLTWEIFNRKQIALQFPMDCLPECQSGQIVYVITTARHVIKHRS